tara:strand:+ start:3268 stop:4473 length:1206 start_codon:yes stop_codon:yes gene_type:complete
MSKDKYIGEWVSVDDLNPWKDNPRQNQSAIDEVAKSIKRFGFASPIIARTEDKMIIAGHTRFAAAKKIGFDKVPVRFMNLDLGEAQLLALADNKIGEIADWDEEKLKEILNDFQHEDLEGLGWSDEELASLIDMPLESDFAGDPDEVPEVNEKAISVRGDIWVLGNHRLLCGDSTNADDVDRLIDGNQIDMVYTDPPYGINLDGDNSKRGKETSLMKGGLKLKSFIDDSINYAIEAFKICDDLGIKIQVWWGANYYAHHIPQSNNWLVWDKRVEEKMTNTNSDCELAWVKNEHNSVRIFRHLWNGLLKDSEKTVRRVHPTQKPIALAVHCFDRYAPDSENILDLFLGSGSTLIAAEQTHKKCFGMEIDPHYCDVIIQRWQNLTGKEAKRHDGKKYNELGGE